MCRFFEEVLPCAGFECKYVDIESGRCGTEAVIGGTVELGSTGLDTRFIRIVEVRPTKEPNGAGGASDWPAFRWLMPREGAS